MLEDRRWANVRGPTEKKGKSLKPQIILKCKLSRFPEALLKSSDFLELVMIYQEQMLSE